MSLSGVYLVLKVNNEIVAETVSVKFQAKTKNLETTSQSDGLYASQMAGKIVVSLSGAFLLASDADNYDTLFTYIKNATEFSAVLYMNGEEAMSGYAVMKRLSNKGGNSRELTTGSYAIKYYPTSVYTGGEALLTEAGVEITTEADETIITE